VTSPARPLAERLAAAGVTDSADPMDAWLRLRAVEGNRATIIDLYELVAARSGLAAHELPTAVRFELARQAVPHIWPGFSVTGLAADLHDLAEPDCRRARSRRASRRTRGLHLGARACRQADRGHPGQRR
jgi:hypothetical protein